VREHVRCDVGIAAQRHDRFLPIQVEAVSGIAALPRIVTLHDIQISPVNDKSSSYDNLTMDVTAKTYRYIEDEGGGGHAGAKKKSGGAT